MEITTTYTERLYKKTVSILWWHKCFRYQLATMIALISLLFLCWAVNDMEDLYLIAILFILTLANAIMTRSIMMHHALSELSRMSKPTISFTITDDKFCARSDITEFSIKWKGIVELVRFPNAWFVFLQKNLLTAYLIPTQDTHEDVLRFIEEKIRENGGKIT